MGALYELNTANVVYPVSLKEAKQQLKLDEVSTVEDDLLQSYIEAATEDAERYIEQAIIEHKYKLVYEEFKPVIAFSKQPVKEILSVKYLDTSGAEQSLPEDKYNLVPSETNPKELHLQFADDLPDVMPNKFDAVKIEFTTGMTKVPKGIIQAIKLIMTDYYENRSDRADRLPRRSESLLRKYRKF